MIILKEKGQFTEFFDRYDMVRPNNLCELFWKIVLMSFVLIGMGAVVGIILMGMVITALGQWWHPLALLGVIAWGLLALVGIAFACKWLSQKYMSGPRIQPQWQRNLGVAYDGFKEKFCPLVRYEE